MNNDFGKLKGRNDRLERLFDDWIFPLGIVGVIVAICIWFASFLHIH